jgi:serine/threonine protein kinase
MPPLTDRITLMRLLSETVERLHAVDWLHKGLRSSNILFFTDRTTGAINLSDPYISGFEYARPAQRDDMTQRPSEDPGADIYRHPATQAGLGFLKSFDLYSLGVVLLEIAYWAPIEKILGIADLDRARPKEVSRVRATLLEDERFSKHVRSHLGLTVEGLVWACLKGPEGFGLDGECDEKDAFVAAGLQREFGERVVKRLGEMRGL